MRVAESLLKGMLSEKQGVATTTTTATGRGYTCTRTSLALISMERP